MKKLLVAAAIVTLSFTAAQAGTTLTEFDFTDGNRGGTWSGNQVGSLDYSEGGIDLTVSSGRWDPDYWGNDVVSKSGSINQYNNGGLGIRNGSWNSESHYIDSDDVKDVAIFEFETDVTLVSVSFSHFDTEYNDYDDFAFFFDKGADGTLEVTFQGSDLIKDNIDDFGGVTYLFASLLQGDFTGNLFGIGALTYYDDFKIASMVVSTSTVPVPAALPLMGSGLALLGFMGWRRKRQAAKA